MDNALLKKSPSGKLVRVTNGYWAFVPNPLPPKLSWNDTLVSSISKADIALGTLSGLGETLPNPHLLIYPFIRREAVLSSRIEGTQSSLSDLLLFEATQVERQRDVKEVQNYVRAMEYGLKRLNDLPLSLRFIRELHGILMEGVRGEHATPGEFRTSQNWIGIPGATLNEANFVPPPATEMKECLGQLEKFLHVETKLPPLIQAALVHYQFEVIHPFLDGNGRIGRLLITLLLCQKNVLSKPLLYLSAFFEKRRQEYYDTLLKVSSVGAWQEWIVFFLQAVAEQSGDAVSRSRHLLELLRNYTQIARENHLPPTSGQLVELIFMKPVLNTKTVQEYLKVSYPSAQNAINSLEDAGILTEITGRKRAKAYSANEVLKALDGEIAPG
ncbi:MAG: cell filamentation protein Fic [Chloroflexi bacterium RBG_16_50_9]|nr:MAG: cell filamentation protein Fic [Chloroflexi bacterium RBG_16_50_9]